MKICESLMEDGIEPFRFEQGELIHNVLLPKRYVWPDRDIPVIPILINCFAPPLATWRRSYELGVALRKAIAGRPERIAIVASGGISHWPPISPEDLALDDPLHPRVARFQMLGAEVFKEDPSSTWRSRSASRKWPVPALKLVNVAWDKLMLEKLAQGDVEYLTNLKHPRSSQDCRVGRRRNDDVGLAHGCARQYEGRHRVLRSCEGMDGRRWGDQLRQSAWSA